jgi:hypothetical protein
MSMGSALLIGGDNVVAGAQIISLFKVFIYISENFGLFPKLKLIFRQFFDNLGLLCIY